VLQPTTLPGVVDRDGLARSAPERAKIDRRDRRRGGRRIDHVLAHQQDLSMEIRRRHRQQAATNESSTNRRL